jgi:mycofactocin precursor
MSKAETTAESTDTEEPDEPEIEDDLVREKLRIDGICGVY